MVVSIGAMIAAFTIQWANDETADVGWSEYMTGDKKSIAKAISILAASWGGVGALDFLDNLAYQQLAVLAATNGLAVPKKFKQQGKV